MDLGASARHERVKMEAVEDAAVVLERLALQYEEARETRDRAVRAAVQAGVPMTTVARLAGLSVGRVSQLTNAPRPR